MVPRFYRPTYRAMQKKSRPRHGRLFGESPTTISTVGFKGQPGAHLGCQFEHGPDFQTAIQRGAIEIS